MRLPRERGRVWRWEVGMLEVRLVSSLEKVGLEGAPVMLEKDDMLFALYVFRGETISFQIAFRDTEGEGSKVSCRARTADGPEGMEVRVRRVLPVMCRRSCDPEHVDGDYLFLDAREAPDLLREPAEGERVVPSREWQSYWVDVCPGQTQMAGSYCVECHVRQTREKVLRRAESDGTGRDVVEIPEEDLYMRVIVRVIGERLPKLAIPHTEWFHCDGIVDYYGVGAFTEEFWRILRNFLAIYVKRGCNTILTPVLTPPLDTEVGGERTTVQLVDVELERGEYRLGFANVERFLDGCLESGIEYFEICHLFTQWGAEAAPKVEAVVDGVRKRIFGWDTPSDDSEYLRFLGVLLPALRQVLDRRGLLGRTFFHISDEPNLESARYRTAQKAVHGLLEGCTVIEAVSDYEYYGKGLVDVPVVATNHIEPFLEKRPPRLWSYYCCAQAVDVPNRFISMPSYRNRIYGILLYWHRIDGFLHWGFNFYNSQLSKEHINPYETVDAGGGFPAGDAFLVYPGEGGVPEESVRLMVQEEGIQDYRALCLLESRIGRDRVMGLIREEAGMALSFRQYPRDAEFLLRLRMRVDKMLAGE